MADFNRESKTFAELLTFTRGSDGTYYDAQGVLQTAAVDEPRLTHDPETGEALGLLIEEQRTRLNTVAASPTTAEDVTVSSVVHTISFFGTGTIDLSGAYTGQLVGTGASDRVTLTFTPTAGTLTITPSGTVENLQLEEGSFETSVILGEGAQVTREADNASRVMEQEFNPAQGTVFLEAVSPKDLAPVSAPLFLGTSDAERVLMAFDSGNFNLQIRGTNGITFNSFSVPPGTMFKAAISYNNDAGQGVFSVNGVAVEVSNTFSAEGSTLWLGRERITRWYLNQPIKTFRYRPRALSATELEALTAP